MMARLVVGRRPSCPPSMLAVLVLASASALCGRGLAGGGGGLVGGGGFAVNFVEALPFRRRRSCHASSIRPRRRSLDGGGVFGIVRGGGDDGGDATSSDEITTTTTTTTRTSPTGEQETTTTRTTKRRYRVLQVHVVHRHGDRTPITPLVNETYWSSQLPHPHVLEKIAEGTELIRDEGAPKASHAAGGRGPFGQLTNLGLMQMVELGSRLREELHLDDVEGVGSGADAGDLVHHHRTDEHGHTHLHRGRLFTSSSDPLRPSRVRVTSTDFPRTVQSVRALLVGLFPDGFNPNDPNDTIEIDVRHTSRLIPDPQPRRTAGQIELERELARRPHLDEREEEMRELASRTTEALRDVLGRGHDEISFGVGEEKKEGEEEGNGVVGGKIKPLPWVQLAEITKCLEVRDLLPPTVSREDVSQINSHAAWRWFEALRHPRLVGMAMGDMAGELIDTFHRGLKWSQRHLPHLPHYGSGGAVEPNEASASNVELKSGEEEPPAALHIYSAHDSTLIGLLCAFRLESPDSWPEYGSYIKVELIEAETVEDDETVTVEQTSADAAAAAGSATQMEGDESLPSSSEPVRHYVRFSLNGEVLRCYWGIDEEGRWRPTELMPLEHLTAMVKREQRRHRDDDGHDDHHHHDDPFVSPPSNDETKQ